MAQLSSKNQQKTTKISTKSSNYVPQKRHFMTVILTLVFHAPQFVVSAINSLKAASPATAPSMEFLTIFVFPVPS